MAPLIFPRQEDSATTRQNTAVGLIAGFVCLVVLLSLLCFLRFHRAQTKRNRERSAASFRAKYAARPIMTESNPLSSSIPAFSRHDLGPIVMPEKSITRKPTSHSLSDKPTVSFKLEPSPSSTPPNNRPLSAIHSSSPRPRTSILNPSSPRHSRTSSRFSAYTQYFFPSGSNSRPSSAISVSSAQTRPVCQLFEAVLPDELRLVQYGEYLTVLRSFDDGWCLVVRDTSRSYRTSRLSMRVANNGDNVDIGLVPAWVFVKPFKGITVSRPFRNASANALQLGQNPSPVYARDGIISWSNFA